MNKSIKLPDGRLATELDWRELYTDEQLAKGAKIVQLRGVSFKQREERRCSAEVRDLDASGKTLLKTHYAVSIYYHAEGSRGDSWDEAATYSCNCKGWSYGNSTRPCRHQAAVMLAWEKDHGPFYGIENTWEFRARLVEEKRQKVRKMHDAAMKKDGAEEVEVIPLFGTRHPQGDMAYVDVAAALSGYRTNRFAVEQYRRLLAEPDKGAMNITFKMETLRNGEKMIQGSCYHEDMDMDVGYSTSSASIIGNRFNRLNCGSSECERLGYGDEEKLLCGHQLYMISRMWDYADTLKSVDQTDEAAIRFFTGLQLSPKQEKDQEAAVPREKNLTLGAKITMEDGEAKVSFTCGNPGGRLYAIRNLEDFARSYRNKKEFQLTKKVLLDFGRQEFEDNAQGLLQFILRRVREIQDINDKLYERNVYRGISVTSQQRLTGSVLDNFYDAALGLHCDYTDKSNGISDSELRIGHTNIRIQLHTERLADARGAFTGVLVSGVIPVAIQGASQTYILNSASLSRVSEEERRALSPFLNVADAAGYFRFQVGKQRLNEYYYRVLPALLNNPYVVMDDQAGEEARTYLPPEPAFTFFLDYDGETGTILCRTQVAYDDVKANLGPGEARTGYRDDAQEERVLGAVRSYLPQYDASSHQFYAQMDDDGLYAFLQEGVDLLHGYGEVQGTEFFRAQRIRRVPQVTVGVSVKSGVMDLSVSSQDLSSQELLDLLSSYRKKKKYFRLKSGEFVDLQDDEQLQEIEELLSSLDLVPAEVIRKKAHLPLFRALYLDKLLEEHEELASTRDRAYRALVKNFRTIKDADFEVPEAMENVLRPYQSYGYKWLRTCEEAGFGAILADEMGLGKTLQMIAVFESDREKGKGPSLVVCPASLVYNWQEEIRRFAPQLKVQTLSGTLSERRGQLEALTAGKTPASEQTAVQEIQNDAEAPRKRGRKPKVQASARAGAADVYITSYDLLKRDIALYTGITFNICVLDEAQYIKNQKAAVAKAVKALSCSHRFALTGTPVENRLSELWSIFDFLMPGFLYTSEEFVRRYETPIAKAGDEEVTGQLKRMVGPFILRRRKEDVLKDLPAKLEEVRYTQLEGEQARLYDAQVTHMKEMLGMGLKGGEDRVKIFAELTRIRQICCDPSLLFEGYAGESAKREACMDLIRSAIDGGHRMLIFSQFTSMLALLEEDLNREGIAYYKIIGATPKDRRLQMVHAFNEGDVPVFLVSLKAGGTGLNLTGADMVIHYDPWWNLAAQNQATDRAHRIGQTRQVNVYRLIAKGTIEDRILELQNAKRDLADAILEGSSESLMSLSADELLALLG